MRPPSVDALARSISEFGLPQPLAVDAAREAARAGDPTLARRRAAVISRGLLRPVVNATGVLLHTNLGRAPLRVDHPPRPMNLEFDLELGQRGERGAALGPLLARLAGGEAALVVNNGAGALFLALSALSPQRVIISRGELVEIGGGFRIPDVITSSGASLVEVGTTNKTRIEDYVRAIGGFEGSSILLKVHRSNYRMVGFTEEVTVASLSSLASHVVVDLGSGLLEASAPWLRGGAPSWLRGEPAVRETLLEGADLVTFSCDKLFGGPQAGVIVGSADLVEQCAKHPLMRVLRPGSLIFSALQDVVLSYLRRDGRAIPFWRMATEPVEALRTRAQRIAAATSAGAQVVDCFSVAGGGSLPGIEIPSIGLALDGDQCASLRQHRIPVIGYMKDHSTILDLRSVMADDDPVIAEAITASNLG